MSEIQFRLSNLFNEQKFQFLELGNPSLIQFGNLKYYLYIKNITSAYFKTRPDVTRIQLGYSPKFNKICKSKIPFILLGLDHVNDVFACWDPVKIKRRINARANISLYSKNSIQASIKGRNILLYKLSNGDEVVLFKTKTISQFLENLENYFPDVNIYNKKVEPKSFKDPVEFYSEVNWLKQLDKTRMKKLQLLLDENKLLDAVAFCIECYGEKYKEYSFGQWYSLIKKLKS